MDELAGEQLPEEELEPEQDGAALEVEESEGEAEEAWSGVAPPDRKLIAQPVDMAVSDLVAQVTANELHLNPVYQRRYVWDDKKASKLVESLLINVPIPVCYLAEESDGTRSTIDGQQRLRSLHRYVNNQFRLRGLEVLTELNGKRFFELSDRQQRLIKNRTIRCIVITEESHPDIRFDVFERLNTGSVVLNAQELRNSVYRGELNQLLHELAALPALRECLGNRTDARMTFEELVLRFFALDEGLLTYRPSLKTFLNHYMRDHRNPDEMTLARYRDKFAATIVRVETVFGSRSFRRIYRADDGTIEVSTAVNSALYDAIMLNFARLDADLDQLRNSADDIRRMTEALMFDDAAFVDAISLATGDRARLHRRVRLYGQGLAALGFDSGLPAVLIQLAAEEAAQREQAG